MLPAILYHVKQQVLDQMRMAHVAHVSKTTNRMIKAKLLIRNKKHYSIKRQATAAVYVFSILMSDKGSCRVPE